MLYVIHNAVIQIQTDLGCNQSINQSLIVYDNKTSTHQEPQL